MYVLRALHNQLRLTNTLEKSEITRSAWEAHSHQRIDAGVFGTHSKSHARAKRKAHHANAGSWKSPDEVVQRRAHVITFANAVGVLSFALAHPAKIESQRRHPDLGRGFCSPEDDLIVHRTAELRVRMADQSSKSETGMGVPFEQGFELAGRARNQQLFQFRTSSISPARVCDRIVDLWFRSTFDAHKRSISYAAPRP